MHKIVYKKSATKDLDKLPGKIALHLLEAIEVLAENPHSLSLDIKKLQGLDNMFRLRVGTYRVIYELQNENITIIVVKIGSRGDVYK